MSPLIEEVRLAAEELFEDMYETVYVPYMVALSIGRPTMCGDLPRVVADRIYPRWWLFEIPEYAEETGEGRADWGAWLLFSGFDMPEEWIPARSRMEVRPVLTVTVWGWE